MNGLGVNPPLASSQLVSSEGEGPCLDDVMPDTRVENGSYHPDFDGNLSPETDTVSGEEDQVNGDHVESSPSDESFADAQADESTTETSSSGSSAGMQDCDFDGGISSGHCFDGWKRDAGVREILFHPDLLSYESICSTDCELRFSDSFLEVKGVSAYVGQDDIYIRFSIDDLNLIESHWVGTFQTAKVRIYVMLEDEVAKDSYTFSGIKKLEFVVTDLSWYDKCEAIQSLHLKYKAAWRVVNDTDMEDYGDALEQKAPPLLSSYFPRFKPFEDFIYPEGDADAVSISKRDVDLLQPDTFLNDTIIDFYIKYLKDKIQPEKRQKFHFFNSFFFRKLADLEKYPSGSFDGRDAFLRVRKWTRKVNLFEKDFIFIPVNHNYHWSLLVICHPGEVANFRDEDVKKLARVPCILHMDSIRGTHLDLKERIKSYLWEEWKERQKETTEDVSSKFSNLRFVSLELPQQQNSYDCGLFLLHYVEQFLEEDPANVNPFKITRLTHFLSTDWFPSSEPSLKRRDIQKLIYDLLQNHSGETSPVRCSDEYPVSCSKAGIASEYPSESISKGFNVNLFCLQADRGLEMTVFPASSSLSCHLANNSGVGVGLGELSESEPAIGSSVNLQCQAFDRMPSFNELKSAVASIEGAVGAGSNIVYSPSSTEKGFHHLGDITPEACDYVCSSKDLGTEASWKQGNSIHQTACEDNLDSLPVKSDFDANNLLTLQVNDKCQVGRDFSLDEKVDLVRHTSRGKLQSLLDRVASTTSAMPEVAEPLFSNHTLDQHDTSYPLRASPESLPGFLILGNGAEGNIDTADVEGDLRQESEVQHAAKRMRLTPTCEGELPKSISGDLCL